MAALGGFDVRSSFLDFPYKKSEKFGPNFLHIMHLLVSIFINPSTRLANYPCIVLSTQTRKPLFINLEKHT